MRSVILSLIFVLGTCSSAEFVEVSDDGSAISEGGTAPYRGPGVVPLDADDPDADEPDAITPEPDVVPDPDTLSASKPDAVPEVPSVPDAVPEVVLPVDTEPVCPFVTSVLPSTSQGTRPSVTVEASSTGAFCFQTCDSPIWGMSWKGMTGRTVTINGEPFTLGVMDGGTFLAKPDTGAGEVSGSGMVLATIPRSSDHYLFKISAGDSASASFTIFGGSRSCSF